MTQNDLSFRVMRLVPGCVICFFILAVCVLTDGLATAQPVRGYQICVANEDVGTASVLNVGTGKVEQIIPVHREPEGVGLSPNGSFFYVTCESDGEIFAVDTKRNEVLAHFNVGGRPRSVAFSADGARAFIPSESAGELHLIDAGNIRY